VSHGRDKGAVDHSGRKAKRSHKIHKQNNAKVIGVIPDFVLERIVEKHALSFFPLTIVLANTDPTLIGWIGNLEAKMIADKSLKDAPMRWNVFMGRKDGEERGCHTRDAFNQLRRFRAARAIRLRLVPHTVQEKSFPVFVIGYDYLVL